MTKQLSPGDPAPSFDAPSTSGANVSLKDCAGKRLVLYFYPKDNTPGCTLEARGFSKVYDRLLKANVVLLGVSRETIASHHKFIDKCSIPFPLLSDENSKICNDYGVLGEKNMFGYKYTGIQRTTFLIDEHGKISKIWRNVSVMGHADEVLKSLNM
ncbi:MAG: thioredoxin-dependent thiol peroxidase [Proteobacteria bacterium]|nr:thioredoxin-dependent thiol peroxidase [Pseudomonadota bacterium]